MDNFDDEILLSFLEESREHLADIENDLLLIEEGGAEIDEDLVNTVFRAAHSIKGGAGFMGLDTIKDLSHKIENVLGMIRCSEIVPNPDIVNVLLLAFDQLRDMINNSETSNDVDISEHVVALTGIASVHLPEENKAEVTEMLDIACPNGQVTFTVSQFDISHARNDKETVYLVEYDLIHDVHKKDKTPLEFLTELGEKGVVIDCKIAIDMVGTLEEDDISNRLPFFVLIACQAKLNQASELLGIGKENILTLSEDLTVTSADMSDYTILAPPSRLVETVGNFSEEMDTQVTSQPQETLSPVVQTPQPPVETEAKSPSGKKRPVSEKSSAPADTNLRVNIKLLDSLMNLAGELVLSRNELIQASTSGEQNQIAAAAQRINLVTSELQEAIMLTRMQPVGNIFNKFPRAVRDLAGNLGKNIELSIAGKDVELDKTIIEGLADPLTHLVRNSADHGIEDPQDRKQSGKTETGQVWLKAFHEAGQVIIEISDDGKGIDPRKLVASAVSKGLITEEQGDAMSDKEKTALIFMPGFSMAETVTDVSGRGVGMDVVKTNLDKLGGLVDIDSTIGRGTTIRIKLPLTLAIIPSLMISCDQHRYALPMVNVVELLRIPANQIVRRVEKVGDARIVRLRQELLPIIDLKELLMGPEQLETETCTEQSVPTSETEAMNIVVVSAGTFKYGLIVDHLHDSEEIVVKPLDQELRKCDGYAGATIMGDGQVALILDVATLASMAELNVGEMLNKTASEDDKETTSKQSDVLSLLTFGSSVEENFAVPVDLVERIERIKACDVESSGGKKIIKYRNGILPIHTIDEVADVQPLAGQDDLLVIVFKVAGREVGLLATAPVDTVDVTDKFDTTTLKQAGIKGSVIIDGKNTLVIDIFDILKSVQPEWGGDIEEQKISIERGSTILYAEDSAFFRNTVKTLLEEDGYTVLDAEDGQIAFDMLDEHADEVSMVVTDMEMPNLGGLGLTEKIRQDGRFEHIPIVALTTLAGDADIKRGKDAGVTEYQVKLDEDKLLKCVHSFMDKS